MADFLQFLFSGITVGATYALVGLGFAIIYNASHVINFAQGEFVMLGGMGSVFLVDIGLPLPAAIPLAVIATMAVGVALEKMAIEPARNASVVSLIIITIGASIFLRGSAEVAWGRNFHSMAPFTGSAPIDIGGAALLPQSLWVLGGAILAVLALKYFFGRTRTGKAMQASAFNAYAARLVGIDQRFVLLLSFALSGLFGAVAGILIAPISLTYSGVGVMLGLKGFCAAILGGMGNPFGAIMGGLLLGVSEAITAGYISSAYKDAVAFLIILLVLFFLPSGLFGKRRTERV